MARRWYESESVLVSELSPGVEVIGRKRITAVLRSSAQAVVTYHDGTSQTFDLSQEPALEVVTAGLK